MPLGRPSISTPNDNSLRAMQTAISNIRQRIEGLEAAAGLTSTIATANAINVSINALRAQIAQLQAASSGLGNAPTGFVVFDRLTNTESTLVLQAGANITISNPDGRGAVVIASTAEGGGDDVLYDNEGRAGLASDGGAIFRS